jgi:hypothetical protein
MSSPITTDQSTYPTGESTHHDNSCNESPNGSQHYRFEQGPPQRRRVNPESLAARLGPELVAEMEKYIIPGRIEMPPFSIRRDIQIKFGIDRRHIYDFFHSRGLRCLNEKAMRNNYLEVSLVQSYYLSLVDHSQSRRDLPEVSPLRQPFQNLGSAELQPQHQ